MVAWKKAVSTLHTTAVQLAADKAQLVVVNTLRSEKCVLESKVVQIPARTFLIAGWCLPQPAGLCQLHGGGVEGGNGLLQGHHGIGLFGGRGTTRAQERSAINAWYRGGCDSACALHKRKK